MEKEQIEELMIAMQRHHIHRLALRKEGVELELEREEKDYPHSQPQLPQVAEKSTPTTAEKEELFIRSPMVGTFYAGSSPEEPPFVKVGDYIDKGTTVCIIEAMKVMNEVKSDHSGTVTAILIESGHPVEFGTKLFQLS